MPKSRKPNTLYKFKEEGEATFVSKAGKVNSKGGRSQGSERHPPEINPAVSVVHSSDD